MMGKLLEVVKFHLPRYETTLRFANRVMLKLTIPGLYPELNSLNVR